MASPRSDAHRDACTAIGLLIRRARKARGLTQSDLADMVGVRFQRIQKYESGLNSCSAVQLAQIALALDAPIQALLPLSLQRKPPADGVRQ